MQHTDYTLTKASEQPSKPRNQAEFRSLYIADLLRVAEANGTLCNLTSVPTLPIGRPTSRTGRKSLRKSFDADCKCLRRQAGVPARTGPPIPGLRADRTPALVHPGTIPTWGPSIRHRKAGPGDAQVGTDTDSPLPPILPTSHRPPSGARPCPGGPSGLRTALREAGKVPLTGGG